MSKPTLRTAALSIAGGLLAVGWIWLMWHAWGWFIRLHCGG